MTLKQFLEKYCEGSVMVEVTDSWYIDQETFSIRTTVAQLLSDLTYHNKIVKSIDNDIDRLLILVEK